MTLLGSVGLRNNCSLCDCQYTAIASNAEACFGYLSTAHLLLHNYIPAPHMIMTAIPFPVC